MSNTTTHPVRALFVGINAYRGDIRLIDGDVAFPPLRGCVADIEAIRDYLASDNSIVLNQQTLIDQSATKGAIVDAILNHLGSAGEEEAILLYFSGHGTIETADPELWPSETDGRLEALVCYYEDPDSHQFLLTDKELRFLLAWLYHRTKAHITTIFDCCHSGDNVRSMMNDLHNHDLSITKKRSYDGVVFPQRPYEQFMFSEYIEQEAFRSNGIDAVYGQVKYLQLAAAESNESALEVGGRGVFSSSLLSVLEQSGGLVSNRDLNSRIRNRIRFSFDQRPVIYTAPGAQELLHSGFLGRSPGALMQSATLTHNPVSGFMINRGAVHGVCEKLTQVEVQLPDGQQATGEVAEVQLDHAIVRFPTEYQNRIPTTEEFSAGLSDLQGRPISVHLLLKDVPLEEAQPIIDALQTAETTAFVQLEDDELLADYTLLLWHEMAYLTYASERFRPLFEPIQLEEPDAAERLVRALQHISQQHFLAELHNQGENALSTDSLEVVFFKKDTAGKAIPLSYEDEELKLDLDQVGQTNEYGTVLQIRIANRTNRDMHIAAVIHSFDFSSRPNYLLEPALTLLEPGEEKWLRDSTNRDIPVSLDDRCLYYNWPESTDRIQFLISTEPFDISTFDRGPLPAPPLPTTARGARGNFGISLKPKPVLRAWNTRSLAITVRNPHYNQLDQAHVDSMLQDEVLAHFALGLYFNEPTRPFGTRSSVPPPTSYTTTTAERGGLWDTTLALVSKWSNFWRNRRYRKMKRKYPDLPRIVAEGDSWFQHPFLRDIIDQVGLIYPTNSVATAGDTLENYVVTSEFVETVADVQPAIFLLSGGGNDVVGEELEQFLQESFPEAQPGTNPGRFFNAKLQAAIDRSIRNYQTIVERLRSDHPELYIFVHGYDYVRPNQPESKGGWIGPYFDKVGILDSENRAAAANYLIDVFNNQLSTLIRGYDERVRYLDLRGTVPDHEWEDEIHPDDNGFTRVGRIFLHQIGQLPFNQIP